MVRRSRHRLGMGLPVGGIAALVLSSVDIARALLERVPELPVLAARNGVLDHQLGFLVQELHGTNTLETRRELRDNIDIPFRDPVTGEPGHVKAKIRSRTRRDVTLPLPYHRARERGMMVFR